MNVTELARKLKLTTTELLEILPEFGFDIGKKAIKVDDKVARKILDKSSEIKDKIETNKKDKLEEFKKLQEQEGVSEEKKEVEVPSVVTVRELAWIIDQPVNQVIKELMKNGVMASLNERIDFETASIIADEFNVILKLAEDLEKPEVKREDIKSIIGREQKSNLKPRAPVVVVMGHVDHGKTKLLDTIRKANVVEEEAGGITQHIGAYQVEKKDNKITFIDTPGHEAFTAMRSRGAKIADVAILVVAANDSIKPQTVEAIKIIQQAKIPMIVAINKIDLPEADIEKVKQDLSAMNLTPEDWGGDTITVPISAKENVGLDNLLDTILLVSEMEKDKIVANPDKEAVGTIIESHIDKGEGPVATILVQNGTLQVSDNICIDDVFFGKARNLKNYKNKTITTAGPSVPVKVIGLKYAPKVGDIVEVKCKIERKHKKTKAFDISKEESAIKQPVISEEDSEETGVKTINLIIRADVLGSLEAITESLEKIDTEEVKVKVISKGLGNITDTDINLADSADALIIGFNVKAIPLAQDLAREKNIEIQYYDVIYKLIEDIKDRLSKLLSPEIIRHDLGKLKVLAIFRTESKSMIIGGKVLEGKVVNPAKADVLRDKELIFSGEITELQAGKQEVNEVPEGQECGLKFEGKPEIQENDVLQVYQEEVVTKKL
ncbi:MAG: translation initiation factor IF-2 [Candidatus Buchananbacteria bacterium]|nr:translation initiation factor IF-2 [Candidatus Buchananbacteria bacterium]